MELSTPSKDKQSKSTFLKRAKMKPVSPSCSDTADASSDEIPPKQSRPSSEDTTNLPASFDKNLEERFRFNFDISEEKMNNINHEDCVTPLDSELKAPAVNYYKITASNKDCFKFDFAFNDG